MLSGLLETVRLPLDDLAGKVCPQHSRMGWTGFPSSIFTPICMAGNVLLLIQPATVLAHGFRWNT